MKIQSIKNHYTPNFGAKVLNNPTVAAYTNYLEEYAEAKAPQHNTKKELELWNKISDAFEKHPSDAKISPSIIYIKGKLFGARGVIETKHGSVIDTEPARGDSWAPLENIFKRVLNPDNKEQLNFLLGEKKRAVTTQWWNENIKPIWNDIKETYSESTLWSKEEIETYKEKQWNKAFQEQDIKADFRKQPNILVEKF